MGDWREAPSAFEECPLERGHRTSFQGSVFRVASCGKLHFLQAKMKFGTRGSLLIEFHGLMLQLVGWIVFAPLILIALYVVLIPVMRYSTRRFGSENVRQQLLSERQSLLRNTDLGDSF